MQIHLGQSTFERSDQERIRNAEAPNSTDLIQICGFTKASTPWHRMLRQRVRSRTSTLPVSTYTAPTSYPGDLWWRVSPKTSAAYSVPVAKLVNEHRKRISGMIGTHERQRERKIPLRRKFSTISERMHTANLLRFVASISLRLTSSSVLGICIGLVLMSIDLIASRLQHIYMYPLLDVIPIDQTGGALIGACISWYDSRKRVVDASEDDGRSTYPETQPADVHCVHQHRSPEPVP